MDEVTRAAIQEAADALRALAVEPSVRPVETVDHIVRVRVGDPLPGAYVRLVDKEQTMSLDGTTETAYIVVVRSVGRP